MEGSVRRELRSVALRSDSTYFEGDVDAVPAARRGYSRDHRPDYKQLVLALVVTPEGFPLTCELFPGNRLDRTTLEHIFDTIEKKFGQARRLWVFDRGIVSEDNLQLLRERGAHYLVGTPKSQLKAYEQQLLTGDLQKVSEQVQVQLILESDEVYVLRCSTGRGLKERTMRRRWLRKLIGDLRKLQRRVREGQLQQRELIQRAIGHLHERHPQAWRWLQWELTETEAGMDFNWDWERERVQDECARRRRVSAARALDRTRPGQAVANLHATDRGGGRVPHVEERSEGAPHLAQRSEVQRRAVESSAHQHASISTPAPSDSLHSKGSSRSPLPSTKFLECPALDTRPALRLSSVMRIVTTAAAMQRLALGWRRAGTRVGFVPTMGYLHAGHVSLVQRARRLVGKRCIVVASIYVNPTQFAPTEDLSAYPRDLERDKKLCAKAGVDVLFLPSDAEMYPGRDAGGYSTYVVEEKLSQSMEGGSRPTHFRGVTTVVAKLFNLVLPDVAVFGAKDWQQAAIIRRMTRDMNFPVKIVVAPTRREKRRARQGPH